MKKIQIVLRNRSAHGIWKKLHIIGLSKAKKLKQQKNDENKITFRRNLLKLEDTVKECFNELLTHLFFF